MSHLAPRGGPGSERRGKLRIDERVVAEDGACRHRSSTGRSRSGCSNSRERPGVECRCGLRSRAPRRGGTRHGGSFARRADCVAGRHPGRPGGGAARAMEVTIAARSLDRIVPSRAAAVLARLPAARAVALARGMRSEARRQALRSLPPKRREPLERLLSLARPYRRYADGVARPHASSRYHCSGRHRPGSRSHGSGDHSTCTSSIDRGNCSASSAPSSYWPGPPGPPLRRLALAEAYLWHGTYDLALVLGPAMIFSMTMAGMTGALIPIVLTALGRDPAQSASIVLTTVTT